MCDRSHPKNGAHWDKRWQIYKLKGCFCGGGAAVMGRDGKVSVGMVWVNPIRHTANVGKMSLTIWCELVKRDSLVPFPAATVRYKRRRASRHCSTACRIFRGSIYWAFLCLFLNFFQNYFYIQPKCVCAKGRS